MNNPTPTRVYTDGDTTIWSGDASAVLASLPDASVDALITDPPYGLSSPPDIDEVLRHWDAGDDYVHHSAGFMSAAWDSFVPGPGVWREALRVCKPGAPALVFAGSRTIDLMMASMRRAGWIIGGTMHYRFGSGFPKGQDVAKAFDRAGGVASREQALGLSAARERAGLTREQLAEKVGCTVASIRDWEEGRARHKGGDVEWLVPSPAYRERLNEILGYSSDERRHTETSSASRIDDGTVYGLGHSGQTYEDNPATSLAARWHGWKTQLKGAHEPMVVAYAPGPAQIIPVVHPYTPKAPNEERVTAFLPGCGCHGDPHELGADVTIAQFKAARCVLCGVPYAEYRHPTVKPLAAMRALVRSVPAGALILDPFVGTGTTAVAAAEQGRRSVVVDASPVHAAMASRRVDAVQPALFSLEVG